MSKQTQANVIVAQGKAAGLDRQTMLEEICAQTGCAGGYAATLFAKAVKAANQTVQTVAAKPKAQAAAPATSAGRMLNFTNVNMDKLREEIQAAADAIAAAHGITLKMGNISYDPDRQSFNTKIAANIGSKEDKRQNDWNKYCEMYGFKKEDFGKSFMTRNGEFWISGIKTRARKMPILADNNLGVTYKFETKDILKHLGR